MLEVAGIDALVAMLNQLVGQKPWQVWIGGGSYLGIDFGKPIIVGQRGHTRGEWALELSGCFWRIDEERSIYAGSEDPRPWLKTAVKRLEGLTLLSARLATPALDTALEFEEGLVLRSFAVESAGRENWLLFTPERMVAVVGPGPHWLYESSTSSGEQIGDGESIS